MQATHGYCETKGLRVHLIVRYQGVSVNFRFLDEPEVIWAMRDAED